MRLNIIALGITSFIMQVLVMREFLTAFFGNELVLGIVLSMWLLLSGAGVGIAPYAPWWLKKADILYYLQLMLGILPLITVILIRAFRNYIFMPGVAVNPPGVILYAGLFLAPYCLISGYLLNRYVLSLQNARNQVASVYLWDSLGMVIGGIAFTFVMAYLFNAVTDAFILAVLNIVIVLYCAIITKNRVLALVTLIIALIPSVVFFTTDLSTWSVNSLYPGQTIIYQKESLYGNLVVTKTQGQLNFYENSVPLFSTDNPAANEEVVHYAMVQPIAVRSVLLVSGGISGTTQELLKYNPGSIDYVELDPDLVALGTEFTRNLERVTAISTDPRRYIKETSKRYDVVIIDLPSPSTVQLNRFYTAEFFGEVKRILSPGGIVSLRIAASENYQSEETRLLQSSVYLALKEHFRNILIIPGSPRTFMASDQELSYDISRRLEERNISTIYVNEFYLTGILTDDRIVQAEKDIQVSARVNRDFRPAAYYYSVQYWLRQTRFDMRLLFVILGTVVCFYLYRLKPVPFAVFSAGFAASALEIALVIAFQVLYGFVYRMIGLLFTAFMVGLVIGSYLTKRMRLRGKSLVMFIAALAGLAVLIPAVFWLDAYANLVLIIIPLLMLCVGVLLGMIVPLAAQLHGGEPSETAASIFSADYMGAFLGAILVSTVLIPLLGIYLVCVLASMTAAFGALIVWKSAHASP